MRGLMVRLARRVNRLLFRRGRFWADRWHGHALKSTREVRNALVYVLHNYRKHQRIQNAGRGMAQQALDVLSSAAWFDGFSEPRPKAFRAVGPPSVLPARTWLLRVGWRRHGLVSQAEVPKAR